MKATNFNSFTSTINKEYFCGNIKRQIRIDSEDIMSAFLDSNSWFEDWNFSFDGLYKTVDEPDDLSRYTADLVDLVVRKKYGVTAIV
jgi:hypothetical protein